jgi:hypothetical protein
MFLNRKISQPKVICNTFFNSNWERRLVPLLTSASGMRTFVNSGQVFSAFRRRGKEMTTLRTVTTDCSLREKLWPYRICRKLEHNFSNTEEKILLHVLCVFCYFLLWPTNAQLSRKLSHSYMFRHYRVILRELVIKVLPSYTNISNAAVGNTVYN